MKNGVARTSLELERQEIDDTQTQIDRIHSQMALYARDLKRTVDAERQKACALAEANARLAILDRLKTDFLAFIAHELRTPLSNMVVLDLLDPNDDPQALAEMIDILRRGYERLEKFVEKGLLYFKWLAADPQTEPVAITDLTSVVRSVLDSMPSLQAPTVTLVCDTPEAPCLVRGEAEHFAQVLHVLVENALKFSEKDACIEIRLGAMNGYVTLAVSDHGRGFAPEMGPELLRPFTIAHIMNHSEGTGLSLALANAIITTYGGTMRAQSAGTGQGATFIVELPEVSLL
ncbi:MAG TPA: HAMP domain-containing sensor histidine kinase [Methylomirabilota bacterium]|jgi:signal transduction histidine kinase|nr:HAMP domain-containing sensor histidine kinase [Methylomirabilota bacterium]